MSRYIDAEKSYDAIEAKYKFSSGEAHKAYRFSLDCIRETPTSDVEPVVHAHWMNSGIGGAKVCSACKSHMGLSNFKYCPLCGAHMDEQEET